MPTHSDRASAVLSEAFGQTVRSLRTESPKPSDDESEAFGLFCAVWMELDIIFVLTDRSGENQKSIFRPKGTLGAKGCSVFQVLTLLPL